MIFVDTSALYALIDASDPRHRAARRIWETIEAEPARLHTRNYVVIEISALVQSRFGMEALRRLHDALLPLIEIHFVDGGVHQAALAIALGEGRRKLSVVDCASFVFMRGSGIRRAFAFDRHFVESGFDLLT